MSLRSPLLGLLLALACDARPAPDRCDLEQALRLAYTPDGIPAFEGQALMIRDCGAGGFCHAGGIEAADRFGAPLRLDFDLRPATTTPELELDEVERLGRDQERTLRHAQAIWREVRAGAMPPGGAEGDRYRRSAGVTFDVPVDDGFAPLPEADSSAGRELLNNWLSCGAPVVERTRERFDGLDNQVGFTAPSCGRKCLAPTWEAIYGELFASPTADADGRHVGGRCAGSSCHSSEERAGELVLDQGPGPTYELLRSQIARSAVCAPTTTPLLVAGLPEESLLWQKLSLGGDAVCGRRMPSSGAALTDQQLCAVRLWIECGACTAGDGDVGCANCLEDAAVTCGHDPGGTGGCADPAPCSPTLPVEES